MSAYEEFANWYNVFMEDIPYEKWHKFMLDCLEKYNIKVRNICDLGCGTGTLTTLFANSNGGDIVGVDSSADMLMVARDNAFKSEYDIFYVNQDITELELGAEFDFIYSSCDTMNYIIEDADLLCGFKNIKEHLSDSGLFIFDMKTKYKFKEVFGDNIYADQTDEAAYIWENFYDDEEEINEYEVTFFIKDEDGRYTKMVENHYQRAYEDTTVRKLLEEAGLKIVDVYDDYSFKEPTATTERLTYIVKK